MTIEKETDGFASGDLPAIKRETKRPDFGAGADNKVILFKTDACPKRKAVEKHFAKKASLMTLFMQTMNFNPLSPQGERPAHASAL